MNLDTLMVAVHRLAVEAGSLELSGSRHVGATRETTGDVSRSFLLKRLAELTPDLQVRTEAPGALDGCRRASAWWCVDPRVEAQDEAEVFAVNVALIEGGVPVLGVVHVPVRECSYVAARDVGAFRVEGCGSLVPIQTRHADPNRLKVVIGCGRRHPTVSGMQLRMYAGGVRASARRVCPSLALCRVADGAADLAASAGAGWSTAAAQAVVEAAGGRVTSCTGRRVTYSSAGSSTSLMIAAGDPELDWRRYADRQPSAPSRSPWPAPPPPAPSWTV